MKYTSVLLILVLIASCANETAVDNSIDMLDQEAVDAARQHIDAKSGFYSLMGETRLGDDCGGYSDVYRLFILRTFSESEVIRIGKRQGEPSLAYSVGRLGSAESVTNSIDDSIFAQFQTIVRSSPFLSMDVHTVIWGVDTPKYHFEWCSEGNYYAVEREWNDTELRAVFQYLEELVADE